MSLFRDAVHAMPNLADVPDLEEKMGLLMNRERADALSYDPAEQDYMDSMATTLEDDETLAQDAGLKDNDDSNEINELAEIRLAREFMIAEGSDFEWLLNRVKNASNLMSTGITDSVVRNWIIEAVGNKSEFFLGLRWDPVHFMEEQFESAEDRLQHVICLCGDRADVQALSCQEYVALVWPRLGLRLLQSLSDAVKSGYGNHEGTLQMLHVYLNP